MAGTIRRSQEGVELVEEPGKSGEKYVLIPDGDRLHGVAIPPQWLPLMGIRAPMVLHGFMRFGQTYWEDITVLANYRQARNFLEKKGEQWGREALAEFDGEGLVNKTSNAGRTYNAPTQYDKYDTGPRRADSE